MTRSPPTVAQARPPPLTLFHHDGRLSCRNAGDGSTPGVSCLVCPGFGPVSEWPCGHPSSIGCDNHAGNQAQRPRPGRPIVRFAVGEALVLNAQTSAANRPRCIGRKLSSRRGARELRLTTFALFCLQLSPLMQLSSEHSSEQSCPDLRRGTGFYVRRCVSGFRCVVVLAAADA